MKRICVFAGSNLGTRQEFRLRAQELGRVIADCGMELVYGGSSIGLMAEVANKVLERGGRVIGVMPTGLFRGEMVHTGLSELIEVKDMHERKAKMSQLSDGYVALPGGYGTFEELFEVTSWAQLGIHNKPIGVLNIAGYFTPLLDMIEHAVTSGFVKDVHKALLISESEPTTLIEKMHAYQTPVFGNKWGQLS